MSVALCSECMIRISCRIALGSIVVSICPSLSRVEMCLITIKIHPLTIFEKVAKYVVSPDCSVLNVLISLLREHRHVIILVQPC